MKNKIVNKIFAIILDAIAICGVIYLAYFATYFNKDITIIEANILAITIFALSVAFVLIITLAGFRFYQTLIEHFGVVESIKLVIVTVIMFALGYIVSLFIPANVLPKVNFFAFALALVTLAFILPVLRITNRVIKLFTTRMKSNMKAKINTLLIGAGAGAKIIIDDTRNNKNNASIVKAIMDDDPNKIGGYFSGIPVKGPISEIATVIDYYKIEEVIISIANLSKERLDEILGYLENCDVQIKRLPILSELDGVHDMKVVKVEIDELLGRSAIKLDNHETNTMLGGSCVLVTGAGGSIGSELVRQIYNAHPKKLILFDIYEHGVYALQQDLVKLNRESDNPVDFEVLIGSVYNLDRLEGIFAKYRPNYIYHAAAYKHVPLMEDSPMEAIRTNVIGTYNVALLADKYQVTKMTLVSTDKAVRPTNTMGATKRFAETIIQYFASKSKHTQYSAVRFGNVLGSNGSVVPLFSKQIEEGGPLTVTDPEINRFFMTIPEAVSLILQSSIYAVGGEIFILDMGKPVKIITLAEKMIRQAGYIPYKQIDIVFTGLRPGEKLYEEVLLDVSKHKKTANSKIYIEETEKVMPIEEEIKTISQAFHLDSNDDIKKLLASVITTYEPDLDSNK